MENFFVILGGMGTLATESYLRVLNKHTKTKSDQDYLDYVLVNHATIPDRTAFILGKSKDNPVIPIKKDIQTFTNLKPDFFVLTCNTAHYFYDELAKDTSVPILHMPRLAVEAVLNKYDLTERKHPLKVGVLATEGTIKSKVYENELLTHDHVSVAIPKNDLQEKVTNLIYRDIKEANYYNESLYFDILDEMFNQEKCEAVILGCTELSLMAEFTSFNEFQIVDAQFELVKETIAIASKQQDK